jgi:DNA-binding transcriptional MerR regulator
MRSSPRPLSPAEAAGRLGISPKALRLYEQRGLLTPARDARGWRLYRPHDLARAAQIVALRGLGLGLARIGQMLATDAPQAAILAEQQAALQAQLQRLARTADQLRAARSALLTPVPPMPPQPTLDLPWPWGGERFVLRTDAALTWITGPLGSGKTRLAQGIAQALPGAVWLGLERLAAAPAPTAAAAQALAALVGAGATPSPALAALLAELARAHAGACVVDMVEDGLDARTQGVLAAWLRGRGPAARPLFLMTRSSAMLDLALAGPDEALLFCPANHSPPQWVLPCPGTPGFEALASCLAPPRVRARTAGVLAWRPPAGGHQGAPA